MYLGVINLYVCIHLLISDVSVSYVNLSYVTYIHNPPFPVLKAGHSVSYSYVCDVCRGWVNEVGFFLFFLNFPVWLVCYAHVFHVHMQVCVPGRLTSSSSMRCTVMWSQRGRLLNKPTQTWRQLRINSLRSRLKSRFVLSMYIHHLY